MLSPERPAEGLSGRREEEPDSAALKERIRDLERQKRELETVRNSLVLEPGKGKGAGIESYAASLKKRSAEEGAFIDRMFAVNKEALSSLGIKSKDELASHPEVAAEPEAAAYRRVTAEKSGLQESDAYLESTLEKLGVVVGTAGDFYQEAEKAIAARLRVLEGELIEERLKTPEFKEAAADLERDISGRFLVTRQADGTWALSLESDPETVTAAIGREACYFDKTGWGHYLENNGILEGLEVLADVSDLEEAAKTLDKVIRGKMGKEFPEAGKPEAAAAQEKFFRLLEAGTLAAWKKKELERSLFEGGLSQGLSVENFDKDEAAKEGERRAAESLLSELADMKRGLPDEYLNLEDGEIRSSATENRIKELRALISSKLDEKQKLESGISAAKGREPNLFGHHRWERKLAEAEKRLAQTEEEIAGLQDGEYPELLEKRVITVKVPSGPEAARLKKMVEEEISSGHPGIIFSDLEAKLRNIAAPRTPYQLKELNRGYQEAEAALEKEMAAGIGKL